MAAVAFFSASMFLVSFYLLSPLQVVENHDVYFTHGCCFEETNLLACGRYTGAVVCHVMGQFSSEFILAKSHLELTSFVLSWLTEEPDTLQWKWTASGKVMLPGLLPRLHNLTVVEDDLEVLGAAAGQIRPLARWP
jgi:hypothetical protein